MMAADVLTYHNDVGRTGANLKETTLTPANVNVNTFGKLGSVAVDGNVYAQPLVKTNVLVPGAGREDLVIVATEHDSVYAFNAQTLAPVWHDSFINPAAGVTTIPSTTADIYPEFGITSTPVIDPTTNTIYVVASVERTTPGGGKTFAQQLHAIDLSTGREKLGGPVDISATAQGSGSASSDGVIPYYPLIQNQRPALLLSGGVIYIASAGYSDAGPYHGWMLGYNAHTLKKVSVFNDTPNGVMGGIWQSGSGPSADAAGNIYISSGNGDFAPNIGNYGDSVMKLAKNGRTLTDYFTPSNEAYLQANDLDLSSGGVMLLPNQPGPYRNLAVTSDKQGTVYLMNRNNLGKFNATSDQIVQEVVKGINYSFDAPAYFNGTIYYGSGTAHGPDGGPTPGGLSAFALVNGKLQSPTIGPDSYNWPGASPSISANGSANGIVWTTAEDPSGTTAVLRAYNASNITQELYTSEQAGTRDQAGIFNKYTPPTIANGKVYVAGKGSLTLFGLLPQA